MKLINYHNMKKSFYIVGIIGAVVLSFTIVSAITPARQNIDYTITDNGGQPVGYYNVQASGNKTFNWVVNATNYGPGDMHPVTIGFWDEDAGSAPTTKHGFSVPASGKTDFAEGESGSFSFSYDTRDRDCGRVQIDGSFIDERYLTYNDDFLFFATIIDYGVNCVATPTPTPTPTPTNPPPRVISSINPAQICSNASPREVTIYGSNLDQTVQTFDVAGNRYTNKLENSINADKTQVIYRIPSELGVGNYQLRVGPNLYDYSNLVSFSIIDCTPIVYPTISISATPSTICSGDSTTLNWSSTDATSVSINNGIGSVALTGSRTISPNHTTTYTATATNSFGSDSDSVTVVVEDCGYIPTISISATPSTICSGDSTTLNWSSTDATSVSINNGIGSVALTGSRTISPNHTTTYTATATNSFGSDSDSVTVVVEDCGGNLSASISALPSNICRGEESKISWYTNDADYVKITPDIGQVSEDGYRYVSPYNTTEYTLYASNGSDSVTRSVTVYVKTDCGGLNNLYISKQVRNITSGYGSESETVNANYGDTVEFIIKVDAGSNNNYVKNLRVYDDLPYGLRYINGSTTVDGNYYSDGITSGGINLGDKYGRYTATIRFRASVENYSYYNTQSLINTARAMADNVNTVSDTATVFVNNATTNGNLTIQKLTRNTSRGETVERTSTSASANDTIEFIIRVKNSSSNTINNVIVSDALPNGLTYVTGSTGLNGYLIGDGITYSGVNIGTLSSGQEATLRFFAKVNSGVSNTTINNTAQAKADNTPTAYSSAAVINIGTGYVLGALTVKTGAASMTIYAFLAAALITLGYFYIERKKPGLLPQIFSRKA